MSLDIRLTPLDIRYSSVCRIILSVPAHLPATQNKKNIFLLPKMLWEIELKPLLSKLGIITDMVW